MRNLNFKVKVLMSPEPSIDYTLLPFMCDEIASIEAITRIDLLYGVICKVFRDVIWVATVLQVEYIDKMT